MATNKKPVVLDMAQADKESDILEDLLKKDLAGQYEIAMSEINQKIEQTYAKYGKSGKIDISVMNAMSAQDKRKITRLDSLLESVNKNLVALEKGTNLKIDEALKKTYQINYEHAGNTILKQTKAIITFDSVDEATAKANLMHDYSKIGLSNNKDAVRRDIKNSVTQSIIQGESAGKMSDRIHYDLEKNANNAMRIARTEAVGARGDARLNSLRQAREMGIEVLKKWQSGYDTRVRASHQQLDQETQDLEDPFSNGLMYCGDQNGPASEVINCRCSVQGVYFQDGQMLNPPRENEFKDLAKDPSPVEPKSDAPYKKAQASIKSSAKGPQTKPGTIPSSVADEMGGDFMITDEELDKMMAKLDKELAGELDGNLDDLLDSLIKSPVEDLAGIADKSKAAIDIEKTIKAQSDELAKIYTGYDGGNYTGPYVKYYDQSAVEGVLQYNSDSQAMALWDNVGLEYDWPKYGIFKNNPAVANITVDAAEKTIKHQITSTLIDESKYAAYTGDFKGYHKDLETHIKFLQSGALNEDELYAVGKYTGQTYGPMNDMLRGQGYPSYFTETRIKEIRDLTINAAKGIAKAPPLEMNTIVTRRIGKDGIYGMFGDDIRQLMDDVLESSTGLMRDQRINLLASRVVNATVVDPAFMSTTRNIMTSRYSFQVYLPEGFKNGLYVENISNHSGELEYIINAGQKMRVIGVEAEKRSEIIIKLTPIIE